MTRRQRLHWFSTRAIRYPTRHNLLELHLQVASDSRDSSTDCLVIGAEASRVRERYDTYDVGPSKWRDGITVTRRACFTRGRRWPQLAGSVQHRVDGLLIAALIQGHAVNDAAALCGVSARTVRRRLSDPSFQAELQVARHDIVRAATDELSAASSAAVRTLLELLAPETSAAVRLGSSKAILELALRYREAYEIDSRLTQLEALAGQHDGIHAA